MAAPLKPQKVPSRKKDTWWFAPAIDDMSAPTDDEINATEGLNFTCYLLAEQEGVTGTTNKATLAQLLCEDSSSEVLDNVIWSLADIQSVFDPQAAPADPGKKTWTLFKDGVDGFLIRRQGVRNDLDSDVTAGQFVDVFKVEIGAATPGKTANDASGLYSFTCGVSLSDQKFNVAVVAAA